MKTRIISGLAMVPFAAFVYFGGWLFWVGICLLSMMGVKEFYDAFKTSAIRTGHPIRPAYWFGIVSVALLYLSLAVVPPDDAVLAGCRTILTAGTFIFLLLLLFRGADMKDDGFPAGSGLTGSGKADGEKVRRCVRADILVSLLGFLYIGLFFFHLVLLDRLPGEYDVLIWLVFITAFGTDIMAYFTGYFLGKHKLAPKISPKKTVEGSIGGVLGSSLLCGVFGWALLGDILLHCMMIGLFGSVVAQLGDLTASVFKRKLDIKDYGNLIPGHGGILDRFDSVLFTSPFVYYYAVLFII